MLDFGCWNSTLCLVGVSNVGKTWSKIIWNLPVTWLQFINLLIKPKNHASASGQIYLSTVINDPFKVGMLLWPACGKNNFEKKKNYGKNSKSRYNAVSIIFSSCCYHKKMNMSIHSMNQTRSGYHKVCTKNLAIQPIKIQMPNKHIFSNFQYYNAYLKKSK